jgi:hypothetical protein
MIRNTYRGRALRQVAIAIVAGVLALGASVTASAQASGMGMMDFEAARDSFFSRADRDGDFVLSDGELMDEMGVADGRLFECEDEDGDGVCGYTDYLDSGQKLFQSLDTNGDGRLSPDEIQ